MPNLGSAEVVILLLMLAAFIVGVVWLIVSVARRANGSGAAQRDLEARIARLENERPRS
ncbi:hypothetical protein [Deinococcus sp.]|uniref:hypothetical protein n=1 Tax=Deinococcus sp. TaxID=47478 RepID=UPI003C7A1463